MNKLYSILSVLNAATAFVTAKGPNILWMEQKLDHFNVNELKMWQMRYLANDELFQTGGPIFIHVGGEETLSISNIDKGSQIYRMAETHHGYLFHTEHRFYGESMPVGDMTNENLKYLDSEQVLADLAQFIHFIRETHGLASSRIILVGCCTGGALATWFKKLYPDLANGVWASSATLLAKTDLSESAVLAGETIRKVGGVDCYNRIKEGITDLEDMFEIKRGAEIKIMFRLCDSFNETSRLDVSILLFEISEIFFNLVTTHKTDEIQKECTKLMHGISELVALGYYIAGKLSGDGCNALSYYSNANYLRDPWIYRNILRKWAYQSCNEFGWFRSSSSPSQIFGSKFPLDYFVSRCIDIFGDKFTKEYIESRVKKTNERYGGLNPNVENVYWTNGGLDPYRLLSVQSGPHATVIPNLSHCGDMHEITPEDSPELKASKEKLERLVREWLS